VLPSLLPGSPFSGWAPDALLLIIAPRASVVAGSGDSMRFTWQSKLPPAKASPRTSPGSKGQRIRLEGLGRGEQWRGESRPCGQYRRLDHPMLRRHWSPQILIGSPQMANWVCTTSVETRR